MADYELKTQLSLGGDKEYKKALKDVNNELKVSKSNMQATMSAYDKGDKSVDALTKKQKALADIFDKQKKKVELMTAQLNKMKESDSGNVDEINRMQIALNNAISAMNGTGRAMDTVGQQLEEAMKAFGGVADGADDLANRMTGEGEKADETAEKNSKFGETMKNVGASVAKVSFDAVVGSLAAVGAAAVAAIKEIAGFAGETAQYVDEINTLSKVTGVSARTLQKWTYASKFIDVSVDTMTGSMTKLTKSMAGGSKDAQDAFNQLGISTRDSSGNLRDSEDVFYDVIDALGKVKNDTERDALAMTLLGKSAKDLNPLIMAGSDALDKLGYEAVKTGYVMENDAMQASQSYQDSLDRMSLAGEGLKHTLGAAVAPTFEQFTKTATEAMQNVSLALKDGLQPGELEGILAELVDEITGVFSQVIEGAEAFIPIIANVLTGLLTTVAEELPAMIDLLLPAAFDLLQGLVNAVLENIDPLIDLAINIIQSLATFLIENIPTIVSAATDILLGLVDGITAMLPELIPLAVEMMAKLAVALVEALPELIERLPEIVSAIIEGLKNIDWIQLGTDLIEGLINGLKTAVTSLISSVTAVFQTIWDAVLDLFGIHSPSTVAADAAGYILSGLVEGFEDAVGAVVDVVKRVFGRIWDAIKSIFGFGKSDESKESEQAGKDIMTGMKDGIVGEEKTVKSQVKETAGNVIKSFRKEFGLDEGVSKLESTAKDMMLKFKSGLSDHEDIATDRVETTAEAIIKAMNKALGVSDEASSKAAEIGKYFAQGFAKGIKNNESTITKAAEKAARAAYDAAKTELGIKSPSRVMMGIGRYYDMGFAEGITGNAEKVFDAANRLADIAAGNTSAGALRNISTASEPAGAVGRNVGGTNINVNYSGPFTDNDAGTFGQYLARSLDLVTA